MAPVARPRRPRVRSLFLVALVLAVLAAGCTGDGGGSTPTGGGGGDGGGGSGDGGSPSAIAPTITVEEATVVLEAADLTDDASLREVDAIADAQATVDAAAGLIADEATGDALWSAVYVYANGGDDPSVLVPLLAHPDPTIRAMAAAGAIATGERAGFEPLVAALTDTSTMSGSEPPLPIWEFATGTLARYTGVGENGPPFDANARRRLLGQERWTAWLSENLDDLAFDPEAGGWSVG
jgi:hypothetical protein